MKINDTTLIVGALAVAVGLVLIPRRAAAATSTPAAPSSTVWDDAATARYREQLRREIGNDPTWMGP